MSKVSFEGGQLGADQKNIKNRFIILDIPLSCIAQPSTAGLGNHKVKRQWHRASCSLGTWENYLSHLHRSSINWLLNNGSCTTRAAPTALIPNHIGDFCVLDHRSNKGRTHSAALFCQVHLRNFHKFTSIASIPLKMPTFCSYQKFI